MKMSKTSSLRKLLVTVIAVIIAAPTSFAAGYYFGYNAGLVSAPTPVRIGHLVADIHQVAFFVAFSKGFYEEEGIMPKRLEYMNGPAEMLAFAAGDLDAGYVGCVPALTAKAKGVDFVIVASANLEGSALVSKLEIETVPELDGKVVGTPGIGTIQDSLLYMVEQKFNIKVTHKHYKVSDLPLALSKGEIDAFIAWEPFGAEAVVGGFGHVVYTSHEILPDHQCCVFYVSGKIFREQPSLARKLIKVHIKAMELVMNSPKDAMGIFANMTGKSMSVVEESWKRMVWDYHVNTTSMEIFTAYLIEQEKVKPEDVPDVEAFISAAVDQKLLSDIEAAG